MCFCRRWGCGWHPCCFSVFFSLRTEALIEIAAYVYMYMTLFAQGKHSVICEFKSNFTCFVSGESHNQMEASGTRGHSPSISMLNREMVFSIKNQTQLYMVMGTKSCVADLYQILGCTGMKSQVESHVSGFSKCEKCNVDYNLQSWYNNRVTPKFLFQLITTRHVWTILDLVEGWMCLHWFQTLVAFSISKQKLNLVHSVCPLTTPSWSLSERNLWQTRKILWTKEKLSFVLCKVWYFTSILLIY